MDRSDDWRRGGGQYICDSGLDQFFIFLELHEESFVVEHKKKHVTDQLLKKNSPAIPFIPSSVFCMFEYYNTANRNLSLTSQ